MAQALETQPYKRSLVGSVGAGLGSLFGDSGKQYYILEHKVSSKYHKVGESQEIIVDQIELGRDPKCQVRFDNSFTTVSRRHAAVIKDGNQWKLVQISSTNPTFLNGRKVAKEWYLQNGDEIQLSIGGPKLSFIVPTGNKATVGSIGLSHRLSLFGHQALKPYKRAITVMSVFLLLAISAIVGQQFISPAPIADLLEKCKDDVYFLSVSEVYLINGTEKEQVTYGFEEPYAWSGTGFLLDDGRFVTARHCVQAWRFENNGSVLEAAAMADSHDNIQIVATIKAVSRTGKELTFKSTDFKYNDKYDVTQEVGVYMDGTPIKLTSCVFDDIDPKFYSTDWIYVKTSSVGKLSADAVLSQNLKTGTELYTMGFPAGIGVEDTPSIINPTFNSFNVGFDGLDNKGCILHTRGTDHGNSGGPVFAKKGNKLVVVGIVSRGDENSSEYNWAVPISNINN